MTKKFKVVLEIEVDCEDLKEHYEFEDDEEIENHLHDEFMDLSTDSGAITVLGVLVDETKDNDSTSK